MRLEAPTYKLCQIGQPDGLTEATRSWLPFAEEAWERQPAIIRPNPMIDSVANQDTIFGGLKTAARHVALNLLEDRDDVSVFYRGSRLENIEGFLPTAEDQSLDQYLLRIFSSNTEDCVILLNAFQKFSPIIYHSVRMFLGGLFQSLGAVPAGPVSCGLFVARYAVIPFDIHKDRKGVFTFFISGKKRFRVWPFEAFQHRAPSGHARHEMIPLPGVRESEAKTQATLLEASRDSVLYWPAEWWHVGESDPGVPHVSLQVTCNVNHKMIWTLTDRLSKQLSELASREPWHDVLSSVTSIENANGIIEVPDELKNAISVVKAAFTPTNLEKLAVSTWVSKLSNHGIEGFPLIEKGSCLLLSSDQIITAHPFRPVWAAINGSYLLSAHGRVLELPEHPFVEHVLSWLQSGKETPVSNLVEHVSSPDKEDAVALMQQLLIIGAIQIVELS